MIELQLLKIKRELYYAHFKEILLVLNSKIVINSDNEKETILITINEFGKIKNYCAEAKDYNITALCFVEVQPDIPINKSFFKDLPPGKPKEKGFR